MASEPEAAPAPSGPTASGGADGLAPGRSVGSGRYLLKALLGQGGMGVVWLAQDQRLGEDLALKFLPPEIRSDQVALDDMRRETLKSRKLSHPNIIRIHDLHEFAGEPPFISMEYVDGDNLSALRLRQPERLFGWAFIQPLLKQLCDALDYAHTERVIHRDLKPSNMMLDRRDRLKLADFGIAATISESMSRVSLRHATSGTVTYMSPQQMNGEIPRTTDDLYALGATLYELLTSRPPFYSGDIVYQVRTVPAKPLDERLAELGLSNEIPADVAALIMACLAKDAAKRPQTARAVAEWIGLELGRTSSKPVALGQQFSSEEAGSSAETPDGELAETISFGQAPRRRFASLLIGAGAFLLLLLIAFGTYWKFFRSPPSAIPTASAPAASPFLNSEQLVLGHLGSVNSVAFSPNQQFFASGSADGTVRVYDTATGSLKWTAKADETGVSSISISSESGLVASAGSNKVIRLWNLATGKPGKTLAGHKAAINSLVFSPTGTYLASGDEQGVVRLWEYRAGTLAKEWEAHSVAVESLAFAWHGNRLATASKDQTIRVWWVPTGRLLKTLEGHKDAVRAVAFSPDGRLLASASQDRSIRLWDANKLQHKRTIQWGSSVNSVHSLAFSPDSMFFIAGGERDQIFVYEVTTAARGKALQWRGHRGVVKSVAFAPDGLAFVSGGADGLVRIWPFSAAQAGITPGGKQRDNQPSPDGEQTNSPPPPRP